MSSRMRSSYLKPPLPKSPIRLRSGQVILSNSSSSTLQTPPGMTNPERRLSHGDVETKKLPIEYSSEFAQEEEDMNLKHLVADTAPVFERGRFYDEYSAKRNERLKRKKVGGGDDSVVKGTPYNLGVEPTTTKRRGTTAKKKTVETTAAAPRYSLRSMTMTKENKKPPLPLPVNVAVTSAAKKKSVTTTMRGRRI
ncbi:hypothetical protein HA466_0198470 [Hirschfeldia incana]|nr:hypothetical protein HA466_0198470 [Hirschfeldia incana]